MGEMYWLSVHLLHISSINKRSAWVVATFKSFRIIMVVLYLVIQNVLSLNRSFFLIHLKISLKWLYHSCHGLVARAVTCIIGGPGTQLFSSPQV